MLCHKHEHCLNKPTTDYQTRKLKLTLIHFLKELNQDLESINEIKSAWCENKLGCACHHSFKQTFLCQEVDQLDAALEAQKNATQLASDRFMQAERRLFEADRAINRFAETLEDTALAIATIADLDKEKYVRIFLN